MKGGYIITILLLIIALIFTFQNTESISMRFLKWDFTGSQALIIILIFFLGFAGGWLLGLSSAWRKNREIRALKRKTDELSKIISSNPNSTLTK
jgi:uncharacterized integral membrane protein